MIKRAQSAQFPFRAEYRPDHPTAVGLTNTIRLNSAPGMRLYPGGRTDITNFTYDWYPWTYGLDQARYRKELFGLLGSLGSVGISQVFPYRDSFRHDPGHYQRLLDLYPLMGREYPKLDRSSWKAFLSSIPPAVGDRLGYESQLSAMYSRPKDWAGLGAALGLTGLLTAPTLRRVQTKVDPVAQTFFRRDRPSIIENLRTNRLSRGPMLSKALAAGLHGKIVHNTPEMTTFLRMKPRRWAPGNFRVSGIRPRTTRGAVLWPLLASLAGATAGVNAREALSRGYLTEAP